MRCRLFVVVLLIWAVGCQAPCKPVRHLDPGTRYLRYEPEFLDPQGEPTWFTVPRP